MAISGDERGAENYCKFCICRLQGLQPYPSRVARDLMPAIGDDSFV